MDRKELFELHKTLTEEGRELMERKNADYGANHDLFANFRMAGMLEESKEVARQGAIDADS